MTSVWERSIQSGSALLLLLAIADFADDDGFAFPSVARLAKKVRLTERQTWSLIGKLKADGELAVGVGGGRGRTNRYRVCINTETGNTEKISVNASAQNPEIQRIKTLKPASGDPSEIRQDPSIRANSQKRGKTQSNRTPQHPWPENFTLTADMRKAANDIATELGITLNPDHEFEAWHDDCLAHDRRYADWLSAWRGRIRNKPNFAYNGARESSPANDPPPFAKVAKEQRL